MYWGWTRQSKFRHGTLHSALSSGVCNMYVYFKLGKKNLDETIYEILYNLLSTPPWVFFLSRRPTWICLITSSDISMCGNGFPLHHGPTLYLSTWFDMIDFYQANVGQRFPFFLELEYTCIKIRCWR